MTSLRLSAVLAAVVLAACGGKTVPPTVPDAGTKPPLPTVNCLDGDGDGTPGSGECSGVSPVDCADTDPSIHPGAAESCNGIDDDCDGQMDEGLEEKPYYRDQDADGFGSVAQGGGCALPPEGFSLKAGDCDDLSATRFPGAAEVCDGLDQDCDGTADDGLPVNSFYPDADGDGFGAPVAQPLRDCRATVPGLVPNPDDCDDANPAVRPGATEFCNKVDDNCDGQLDNGVAYLDYYLDADGDGFGAAAGAPESACIAVPGRVADNTDCDDGNAAVKPGAAELCDGLDNDCNGSADEGLAFTDFYVDADGDGFGVAAGVPLASCKNVPGRVGNKLDCDDGDANVKPGAAETCDGADEDCDGTPDDGLAFENYYVDADGDGRGAAGSVAQPACLPVAGRVTSSDDCDDTRVTVKPGAAESCNGVDDDCDGAVDDGLAFTDYYPDADGDGHGAAGGAAHSACAPVAGKVTSNDDCDDNASSVKPGAAESCNALDDDCDTQVDEGLSSTQWYVDADGDGHGTGQPVSSCSPITGRVSTAGDCDDTRATVHPGAPEQCNGVDDDCNGTVDNDVQYVDYFPDLDGDGFGAAGASPENACVRPGGKVPNAQDCDDADVKVNPGAAEACNGADDDCDGQVDEGLTFLAYYPDLDSDGHGSAGASPEQACAPPPGKVTLNDDCDDTDAAVNPSRAETCNGADENCNGQADEGLATQAYYVDGDGDGHGDANSVPVQSCRPESGRVANNQDCNDASTAVKPGAPEGCNNADDDCDGQVDEGNPGGGGACSTGLTGVCGAGTLTCSAGALTCAQSVTAGAERCDGLDNDCDGQVDETFTNKGQACTAGLGVCERSGTYACAADGLSTTCDATAGAPTAAACDGLDNDCDGVADDPALVSTQAAHTTAWTDVEVVPYHYTASTPAYGCNGGLVNTAGGGDVLVGGWLVMAGGTVGIQVQKLDASGAPVGTPTSVSGLKYSDVAAAQSRDGILIAGVWNDQELDLYYVDGSTGAKRDYLYTQFKRASTTGKLDSLRMVRGSSGKVTLVWRESGVGLKLAQVKPTLVNSAWEIRDGAGNAAPFTAKDLVVNSTVMAGVGADSNVQEWLSSISCSALTTMRTVAISYVAPSTTGNHSLRQFTVNEDGTTKSAETTLRSQADADGPLAEPDVTFYRYQSADHWLTAYTETSLNYSPAAEDLLLYMTSAPGYKYAWLQLASDNGADSIQRPRASFTGSEFWVTGLRYVDDPSGLKRQVMTRRVDLAGLKIPTSSSVEVSATVGACPAGDVDCRPGEKAALVSWAAKGKVYYSGSGATPSGTWASSLSCQ
ncbi:MAG: hypothetical protein RL653_439 [Pseudomonadota bacterium]|jgi:hypothetical protein